MSSTVNIDAQIVDQRIRKLVMDAPESFPGDEHGQRSAAFALLCMQTVLALSYEEAWDTLTEGGQDQGVDALHIGDVQAGEFTVTLCQAKYVKNFRGDKGFPANSIQKVIDAIGAIFDPSKHLSCNALLDSKVVEIRSLISDGELPVVRVLACNNGLPWQADAQEAINRTGWSSRVVWEHLNHERLLTLLTQPKTVEATLQLQGQAIVENYDFRRVLVGRLPVAAVAALFEAHGDSLLEQNIRRYLGLRRNRVNMGIHDTLVKKGNRAHFYFYNNGITAVCRKFSHNQLQGQDWHVRIKDLQIVNGGQTCKTIQQTLSELPGEDFSEAAVLFRLYEVADDDHETLVPNITFATNSQNPVDLGDLRANDEVQIRLREGLLGLGFEYKTKRDAHVTGASTITASVAAEAVMALFREKPHIAKFRRRRLFGPQYYNEIFAADLSPAQVVLAVQIFRYVENERRRPSDPSAQMWFTPYASHFLTMLLGQILFKEPNLVETPLSHVSLAEYRSTFDEKRDGLYKYATELIKEGLVGMGVDDNAPRARVAGTFRRGDLLTRLLVAPIVRRLSVKASRSSDS